MDWLTFKFCVFIWVLCVSKSKSQSQLLNSTSSLNNLLRSACEDGQPIVPPDHCNNCICFAGQIYCTNIPCPEQDCVNGVDLPQPDACNKCICRRGKVTCSKVICIPAPHCAEKQLYPAQNKCNACMCMKGFITCTSNPCAEEPLPSTIPTTTTKKPKKKRKCIEGESLPGPNECIECFCQNGGKRCKNICNPTLENRFGQEPECVPGQHIPRPDDCNNCICFEGQIHCTHLPCRMDTRIGPECSDDQPVFRPDECNECYCFEGRLECSDLVCIRGSKCVQGQVIPKPDSCNACKCVEGHILCTDYQCPILNSRNALRPGMSSTEVRGLDECQEGDIISPPPPPNDCNTCFCMDNRILCTMNICEGFDPDIKGRLSEPNEQTDLEIFDKQISVEPFIHMLSKNYEKLPAKLIHTHAYNGFHQEIKVHASHIPKDATKLLKVLATSLDHGALASISQTLLTSSNSLSNNHDSKIPLDHQVVQTNSFGEGNVLTNQSSKLITSGSQSNETILVLPFDGQNSQSVLPLTNKHETIWKSVSSPGSLAFNNNQEINPHSIQEEKLNVYHYDNPPSLFTPIDQTNVIRNPSKFSRPGHQKHARNTVHIPNTNPQSIYSASNSKSTNINDGKMSYAPFFQEIKQFKSIPSGFVSKHDELPHLRPYQQNLPGHIQVYNYTSSLPILRPGKIIGTPNNNDGQQKQFLPNFSKYYQVKTQQIPLKDNQNHLPTLNNKGIQHPPLFLNSLNQPIVAVKQPQLGIKPGQGSVSPFINIGNQTDQQFMAFLPNFQINPPLINLPNQKKRISNEVSKETPPHSMVTSSTAHDTNILNPPPIGVDPEHTQHKLSHSQLVPNPSIYYKNEYEAPKIIEVNPDLTYKHTEQYNPPHTSSEFRDDTLIANVRNKTRKYNTTHSHYEKHTTITYVSEYDPTHPANPLQIVHDTNQHQNAPQTYAYEHYLPDQESQELDLTMSKVNYYLNLPNLQLDQNEPQPKLTHYYPSQTTIFPESAEGPRLLSNSAEDPTHQKSNEYLPPPSPTGTTQNQHPPGVFDDRGSTNGFQYAHNAYEDPRQLKPDYKLPPSKLETPQNHQLSGFVDERESADGFQYPSNSEDLTHSKVKLNKSPHFHPYTSIVNPEQPKDNLHISPHSQFGPAQNQHNPGLFDNRGVKDGFQYAHNADKNPTHPKPVHKLLPITHSHTPLGPTLIQHSPGIFDERAAADGFQYPSNSAENPIHSRGNLHNPKLTQFGPTQNQHLPGRFDERGSADGFPPIMGSYPSNSAENPLHPKENIHKQPNSPFGSTTHNQLPGMFDERGSADGFQYPSNSAEKPLDLKQNTHKPPNSPFGSTTYKQLPGIYPHNSAGIPTHPKNLTHPEQNKQKQQNSQVGPNHNKLTPGMFDGRGSPDGFQYLSNSPKNPLHPKDILHYPPHSQFGPPQNQHSPGVFHNRGSPGVSNSAKNLIHPKNNPHKLPQSQFLPSPNQHTPGVFDNRGSTDRFKYPSNSAENPTHPKNNLHKLPQSQFLPSPYQHTPGVFDERGSADGFQYISNSVENPTHPKNNPHKLPQSQFLPSPNQHTPGVFDNRGSTDRFKYPSNSAENPTHPKNNLHKLPQSQFLPSPYQHTPGVFDERGSADGFQYISNSVENPTHPKNNPHKLPQSQFLPSPNQHTPGVFDNRGSTDRFKYPSNSVENPTHPKNNLHKFPQSQFLPSPNQHTPGVFDDRGSADGFQYPSNSAENPTHPKNNLHKLPQSQFLPSPNQHTPGVFDDRGSADGFQYPSNSAENPTHPKQNNQIQPNSPIDHKKNQNIPGMFGEHGSADGFQYPSNSAETPTHPKDNLHKLPQSQFLPSPNQHTPGVFDDRGSAGRFHYPSNSAEDSIHPKGKPHHSPLGPAQNQHLPGMFDERGSADGFQYLSNSANSTHTKNNPNTNPESKFEPPQNQPSSSDDVYYSNPLRPWMHLDHDQYKPSSFDNLLNGVHNIPWSSSSDQNKDSDTVTSAPKLKFTPDYDQYKPSSFDNLFNGIHQIPWAVSNQDNNALGSDAEITTPRSGVKPKQDQYGPSMVIDPSISNQNENIDHTDIDDNQLQIEQDVSTPSTDLTDSVSIQYNVLPKLKPDSDPDSLLPTDDGKIPDYYEQLYPLIKAVKKLSDPPIDDSVFSVGSMDQLDLLPFLFPGIAKILNYEPSQDQDDISPVDNHDVQRNPISKLKSKLKQLPENHNGILNWLKSKLNKLVPRKYNATVTKNDIDMTKIFNLLSKLTPPNLKDTAVLQNIPFNGFDPEIIENIMNDFKEDILTTTSTPPPDSTRTYENRFQSVPTISEESRPQASQLKYPDVHIILHQPNDEDDVDILQYTETDGKINIATDIDSEELSASMFPKMFNARFRYRPKDQKEECGDGTQWISNCHSCSCYFGQAMCVRLPDCELRPLGEPMTCKPYSHFKMGCYTCECNGDGVAECDATDCNTQPSGKSRGSTESQLPVFHEFFDSKETNKILQYYNYYKKLPKDCPNQDLQTQYPTCERGTSWVSSCHKCECKQNGKHECIKIDDCKLDIDKYGQPGRCKPNSKFYPKTNSMPCVECSCNDEGISYCPAADYKKH